MQDSLWGISFDAVAVSGVVTEFAKLTQLFHARHVPVYLDLGYDIKADKNNFFVPYRHEIDMVPPWLQLDRLPGLADVPGYNAAFVQQWFDGLHQGTLPATMRRQGAAMVDAISRLLLAHWEKRRVAWVVVENGTLPENTIFTQALYDAIAIYGRTHRLGQFVLWRDHDLMWSSETSVQRYGEPPYDHVIEPVDSPHIRYLCLDAQDHVHLQAWVPHVRNVVVLPNRFDMAPPQPETYPLRAAMGIDRDVPLLARTTRIIHPKRLDRDIHLLAQLNTLLPRMGFKPAHLAIAGDVHECPNTAAALRQLAADLRVQDNISYLGKLAPDTVAARGGVTVGKLMAEADLVSFLTAYDYDSYGNPVGEAAAAGVPFCATRYARYDAVWGSKGLLGPVLEISARDDELPDVTFVQQVAEVLTQPVVRSMLVAHNRSCAERIFSDAPVRAVVDAMLQSHAPRRAAVG